MGRQIRKEAYVMKTRIENGGIMKKQKLQGCCMSLGRDDTSTTVMHGGPGRILRGDPL
jgi:hypothetical protein